MTDGVLKEAGGFPHSSIGKESACTAGDPSSIPVLERSAREGIGYPLQYTWASPFGSAGKESACNAGDPGSIPGSGISAREGIGYPLQYSWASLLAQIPWKRERLPIPVFWPEEFHGLYSPQGRKESDTTEQLSLLNT